MKKNFPLLLLIFWTISCSTEEPTFIYGPDESYFEILENEKKVKNYQIYFHGKMELEYSIYEVDFNMHERKGKLLTKEHLSVNGEEMLEFDEGYQFFDFKVLSHEEASFDIFFNAKEMFVGNMPVNEYNTEFSYLIPYKYPY